MLEDLAKAATHSSPMYTRGESLGLEISWAAAFSLLRQKEQEHHPPNYQALEALNK